MVRCVIVRERLGCLLDYDRRSGFELVTTLAVYLDHSISRVLTVLKTRASHHAPEAREFQITTDGITIT
jgi:hypothetical protein